MVRVGEKDNGFFLSYQRIMRVHRWLWNEYHALPTTVDEMRVFNIGEDLGARNDLNIEVELNLFGHVGGHCDFCASRHEWMDDLCN